jgi:hypothetical protein
MKNIFVLVVFTLLNSGLFAQNYGGNTQYQRGYYKKSTGTYVQPHTKTKRNRTNHDNFSTDGNYNINNGKTGSRAKDYSPDASKYGEGQLIHTGPRGGQYYRNSNGRKVYVPKR